MDNQVKRGLEGVIATETEISLVDGERGRLVYRGNLAKELALNYSFEEVAYLLLFGQLPSNEELVEWKESLRKNRALPKHLISLMASLPKEMDMMSYLRTCLSALDSEAYRWPPTEEQAMQLIAITPSIIAYRWSLLQNGEIYTENQELDHIANYLYMISGKLPSKNQVRALEAYFILTMEHGLNASTFTARVISSTEADIVSAVTGAIGAMKGPLHGGAPSEVIQMLEEIAIANRAEKWLRNRLENKKKLMGFGHRIYKTIDPRAEALKKICQSIALEDSWLQVALHVEKVAIALLEEYKPGRKLYTNVEFYAAAILKEVGLALPLFTPSFTASRMVGWTAHILEQSRNNKIYRPNSLYTGIIPLHTPIGYDKL